MRSRIKSKRKLVTVLATEGGSFTMPGGFKVTVEVLGKQDASEEMGNKVLAQYYQSEHKILLKRTRSMRKRKADLEHELGHMCIDWADHFVRKAHY